MSDWTLLNTCMNLVGEYTIRTKIDIFGTRRTQLIYRIRSTVPNVTLSLTFDQVSYMRRWEKLTAAAKAETIRHGWPPEACSEEE
jgi:hypothetical protein